MESPAKINLYLDILGKRQDGFHEVEMVMQSISLCDRLTFIRQSQGNNNNIELLMKSSDCIDQLPVRGDNLIIKAARLLMNDFRLPPIKVILEKNIPTEAGLAGGSSNAAATLWAINHMFQLGLTEQELSDIGARLGSDIPFCLFGGTKLAKGRGEILHPLPSLPNCYFVLVKPNFGVSTGKVYQELGFKTDTEYGENHQTKSRVNGIISGLEKGTLTGIVENMYNKMEEIVFKWHRDMQIISQQIEQLGALKVLMSGSGSTIFGVFDNYDTAKYAKKQLEREFKYVFLSIPRDMGVGKENN